MFFFCCSQKTLISFHWLDWITKFLRKSYSGHCIPCLDRWIMNINDFLHSIWVIFWKYCEIILFTRAFLIVYWLRGDEKFDVRDAGAHEGVSGAESHVCDHFRWTNNNNLLSWTITIIYSIGNWYEVSCLSKMCCKFMNTTVNRLLIHNSPISKQNESDPNHLLIKFKALMWSLYQTLNVYSCTSLGSFLFRE